MNREEFEIIKGISCGEITPQELVKKLQNKEPRCLLSGYTLTRRSFVIDLGFDGSITKYVDDEEKPINNILDCIPNKRVYPAKSDFEFCQILQSYGIEIPFTCFI